MGSGSTLVAARALKRHGLGIEIDKSAYELAMTRVYEDIPDVPSDNLADIPDT
jgi:DNA modification methylase